MLDAVETLREAAETVNTSDAVKTLWTNKDGSIVSKGQEFRDLLVGQVSSPVRWDKCMESFAAAGVTGIIELAPAGALVGLAKRGLKGVPTVAVKTPEDLVAARELIDSVA
jgi:[acyl-carrier-protein] S-malonyltransferase